MLPATTHAQTSQSDGSWFVRAGIASAYILPTNPFTKSVRTLGDAAQWGPNLTIDIGRQTDGSSEWHRMYGMPSYGFGFSMASFHNGVQHNQPLEAYTFFSWPFAPLTEHLDVTSEFGMGVSWHWRTFNEQTATYDAVLGSDLNARINWGFYLRYVSRSRVTLYSGIDFTHRSNGGVVQPDRGINVIGPKLLVRYDFNQSAPRPVAAFDRPPFRPSWEFLLGGAAGLKNVVKQSSSTARQNFTTVNVTAAVQRHFYRFGKLAAGTDVHYDGSTGSQLLESNTWQRADPGQRWTVGAYGGYEHVVGRFGAFVHIGGTVARSFESSDVSRLYSRYGWRYQFTDHLWTTFAVRAIRARNADALEFGIGYRWSGRQRPTH